MGRWLLPNILQDGYLPFALSESKLTLGASDASFEIDVDAVEREWNDIEPNFPKGGDGTFGGKDLISWGFPPVIDSVCGGSGGGGGGTGLNLPNGGDGHCRRFAPEGVRFSTEELTSWRGP